MQRIGWFKPCLLAGGGEFFFYVLIKRFYDRRLLLRVDNMRILKRNLHEVYKRKEEFLQATRFWSKPV